jgi:hypothetical protein
MQVDIDPVSGSAIYDGSSQDEKILLQLAQEHQIFDLVKRDEFSLSLKDKR